MVVFILPLLLILTLGASVLAMVMVVGLGRTRADQTVLGRRLRVVMDHLNGDADLPPVIRDLFAPGQEPRPAEVRHDSGVGAETVLPEAATTSAGGVPIPRHTLTTPVAGPVQGANVAA